MRQWDELDRFKQVANRRGQVPQMQEFLGCGTIFVWNHSLDGGPGREFMRAGFSYKNTSDVSHDWVRIWMEARDAGGRVVNRSELMLIDLAGRLRTRRDEGAAAAGRHHQVGLTRPRSGSDTP
jgi:hypothetical protein